MPKPLASLTIENFFNMRITEITCTCYHDNMRAYYNTFYDIADKKIIPNADLFILYRDKPTSWSVNFKTERNELWASKKVLTCDYFSEDDGNVTIGVNGDSKKMYVAFPSLKSCSVDLIKIN